MTDDPKTLATKYSEQGYIDIDAYNDAPEFGVILEALRNLAQQRAELCP